VSICIVTDIGEKGRSRLRVTNRKAQNEHKLFGLPRQGTFGGGTGGLRVLRVKSAAGFYHTS